MASILPVYHEIIFAGSIDLDVFAGILERFDALA